MLCLFIIIHGRVLDYSSSRQNIYFDGVKSIERVYISSIIWTKHEKIGVYPLPTAYEHEQCISRMALNKVIKIEVSLDFYELSRGLKKVHKIQRWSQRKLLKTEIHCDFSHSTLMSSCTFIVIKRNVVICLIWLGFWASTFFLIFLRGLFKDRS